MAWIYRKLFPNGWGPIDTGWLLTIGVIVLVESIALPTYCVGERCSTRLEDFFALRPSEMGDTLAGIFSALAFIWIIVTVFLQSKELSEQRAVFLGQKEEFEKQNENLREQIFDNTFFQLLSSQAGIIQGIDLNSSNKGRTIGRDCFRVFYSRLGYSAGSSGIEFENFEKINENFFAANGHEFGHYFRFLFNFFRFLDNSEHTKNHHVKVLRASLSDYELLLMYYNCVSSVGKKFEHYITKYELFDNLPVSKLFHTDHLSFYPEAAFGQNEQYWAWKERNE
ncbi:MAG: putative phage abortive infection protein [Sulfitobacter sp.]|nr:putative phage abortive infection protein [Sulfitobacter sp.]